MAGVDEMRTLTVDEAVRLGAQFQEAGRIADASQLYEIVLKAQPDHPDALHLRGVVAMQRGDAEQAARYVRMAIAQNPHDAAYHSNLGAISAAQGRYDDAIIAYRKACTLEPSFAVAHKGLGRVFDELHRYDEAVAAYRQAVAADPTYAEALNNLGIALRQLGDHEGAIEAYDRAIALRPDYVKAYLNRGVSCSDRGRFAEAESVYRKMLELDPELAAGWNNLGNVFRNTGSMDQAEDCFRRALALDPELASAHNNLANVLSDLDRTEEAAESYTRAIRCDPGFVDAFRNLGLLLARCGEMEKAVENFRNVLRLANWPMGELLIESLCPLVFESRDGILEYRRRLRDTLHRFEGQTFEVDPRDISSLAASPSFNIPFHGEDDRPIKEAYGRVFARYFPRAVPELLIRTGRPKVGFIVTHGHEGIFMRSLAGVIQRLDQERFEPIIACSPAASTTVRACLPDAGDSLLVLPSQFGAIIDTVREARFDVLYFWEVAVDWLSYFLPYHRLAPVQCTSWGIQVTSGIPTMDYYLSSELVEAEEADAHYSETLLRARTLLTYRKRLPEPDTVQSRAHFGLREDSHLYVCAQNIGKIHPDFDAVLAAILLRDPEGIVALTGDRNPSTTDKLQRRLRRSLGDLSSRLVLLPRQESDPYRSLLLTADVLLDPIHFGGVNSTYDGLSFGKPIVTWPSRFQRGRYTLGCYRKMGVLDCVANSPEEYVDVAVRLGTDAAARESLHTRLLDASEVLFEDEEAVQEHERLFALMLENAHRV